MFDTWLSGFYGFDVKPLSKNFKINVRYTLRADSIYVHKGTSKHISIFIYYYIFSGERESNKEKVDV